MDAVSKALLIPRPGTLEGALCFPAGAIVLYHDLSVFDLAERTLSGSFYSHCGIALGNGTTVCAFAGHGVWTGFGDEAQGTIRVEARMPPAGIDAARLVSDALREVGKPYDYVGLPADPLGDVFFWIRSWFSPGGPDKTFHCSSLIARELQKQGVTWNKRLRAVTPQDIANYVGL